MIRRSPYGVRGAAALAAVALAVGGCTFSTTPGPPIATSPDDSPYQPDTSRGSLEIPPDLSSSGIQEAYPIPGVRDRDVSAVLPEVPGMRIEREGTLRWLAVEAEAGELWPVVRDFWRRQGFDLDTDDPQLGVMETGWAEQRVQLPVGGVRRALERFKRFAYTYAVRDRFRTRMERNAVSGKTDVFISHSGAQEEVRGDSYAWTPRPSNPDIETEMLRRLMLHLGRGDAAAVAAAEAIPADEPLATLVDDPAGGKHLRIDEGFDRAWRLVRRALDRGGFTVVDLDRSAALFLVRYIDSDAPAGKKGGWLRRLAFWRDRSGDSDVRSEDSEFRLVLERGDGPPTLVVVQDEEGARDTSGSAGRILAVLGEHIE